MVAQNDNLPPEVSASHIGPCSSSVCFTSKEAPYKQPGKVAENEWPKCLGPCTHVGDVEEVPGSQLQTGPALAIMTIAEVKQQLGVL